MTIKRSVFSGHGARPDTAYKRFDRWYAAGVRERLAGTPGVSLDEVRLDSTAVKAHPVASTGRRRPA